MNLDQILFRRLALVLGAGTAAVALNVGLYVFAVSKLEAHTSAMKEAVAANRKSLREMEAEHKRLNVAGDRLVANRKVMEELRDKVLLTQEQRLVAVQTEIQRLVEANGLDLQNISYAYESLPRPPQGPWANRYVRLTVQLPLSGTYPAVKAFIRDLLASPQFLSVDELALSGGTQTGVLLRMNLQVSTAFLASEETAPEEAP
ncbi:MAG: GspMb/PilO family protein [Acidobacteriota bacterium]